eukprot:scaffold30357_cov116-Isochrysis_galbana.AAC.8
MCSRGSDLTRAVLPSAGTPHRSNTPRPRPHRRSLCWAWRAKRELNLLDNRQEPRDRRDTSGTLPR